MNADDVDRMEAGYETDDVVGMALGLTWEPFWVASSDGGESATASTTRGGAWPTRAKLVAWLRDCQSRGLLEGHEIIELRRWPRFSTDPAAAIGLLVELQRRGHTVKIWLGHNQDDRVTVWHGVDITATGPFALAAARAALKAALASSREPGNVETGRKE